MNNNRIHRPANARRYLRQAEARRDEILMMLQPYRNAVARMPVVRHPVRNNVQPMPPIVNPGAQGGVVGIPAPNGVRAGLPARNRTTCNIICARLCEALRPDVAALHEVFLRHGVILSTDILTGILDICLNVTVYGNMNGTEVTHTNTITYYQYRNESHLMIKFGYAFAIINVAVFTYQVTKFVNEYITASDNLLGKIAMGGGGFLLVAFIAITTYHIHKINATTTYETTNIRDGYRIREQKFEQEIICKLEQSKINETTLIGVFNSNNLVIPTWSAQHFIDNINALKGVLTHTIDGQHIHTSPPRSTAHSYAHMNYTDTYVTDVHGRETLTPPVVQPPKNLTLKNSYSTKKNELQDHSHLTTRPVTPDWRSKNVWATDELLTLFFNIKAPNTLDKYNLTAIELHFHTTIEKLSECYLTTPTLDPVYVAWGMNGGSPKTVQNKVNENSMEILFLQNTRTLVHVGSILLGFCYKYYKYKRRRNGGN